MHRKEFIESFAASEEEHHRRAEQLSGGLVRYEILKDVVFRRGGREVVLEFCEVCRHPRGTTYTLCEIYPSFEGVEVGAVLVDARERAELIAEKDAQVMVNVVIPPEPEMIFQLAEHVDVMLALGNFAVTLYEKNSGKKNMILVDSDFLEELRLDPSYSNKSNSELFSAYLMSCVEMLC
ncbi:MAG: hypothetical protein GXN98_03855 [Euryarchaeota archaeon]|nr:hypothetical protein [Euryarchaeota archaeon]